MNKEQKFFSLLQTQLIEHHQKHKHDLLQGAHILTTVKNQVNFDHMTKKPKQQKKLLLILQKKLFLLKNLKN